MRGMVALLLGGVIGALFMAWFYAHGGNLAVGGKTWGPQYEVLANCVNNERAAPKVVVDVSVTPSGSSVPSSSNIESVSADSPTRKEEPLSIFNERSRNLDPSRGASSEPLKRTAGADGGRPSSYSTNPPPAYTMIGTPADLSNMFVVVWPKCF